MGELRDGAECASDHLSMEAMEHIPQEEVEVVDSEAVLTDGAEPGGSARNDVRPGYHADTGHYHEEEVDEELLERPALRTAMRHTHGHRLTEALVGRHRLDAIRIRAVHADVGVGIYGGHERYPDAVAVLVGERERREKEEKEGVRKGISH